MVTNTAAPCRMVHDTDIVELELRSKRFSLAVRKKEAIEALEPQVVYQVCWQYHAASLQMTSSPFSDNADPQRASVRTCYSKVPE